MTKEKYKIRVSYHTYYALYDDMYTYNFCKDNGEPNKNKFFNTLISGFYNNFTFRRYKLTEYLADKYSNKFKEPNDLVCFTNEIFSKINELYNSDITYKYHNCEIYIYPTKETTSMYDEIETNETKNESISEFIRNLLHEYLKEPGYEREKCLHWKTYKTIAEAIDSRNILCISNTREAKFDFKPFCIMSNGEENFNYLVGLNLSSKTPQMFSMKLSRIKSITIKNEYFTFTPEELKKFHVQLQDGPEFICKDTSHAVIIFDKQGVKKYDACYKDRPMSTDFNDDTGEYIFDTDINKLYLYLLQFGKHAKVIEPISLKNKLNNFHKEAIDEDE